MSEKNYVLVEENEDQTITTIKLNRLEKRNALNWDVINGLEEAIEEAERSKTRVIIITGASDYFSAGIDLNTLSGQDSSGGERNPDLNTPPHFRYNLSTRFHPLVVKIGKIEKPFIARIEGFCLGLGFELALACDFRFCLENASFSMPEVKVGIIPFVSGTTRLTRLCGISHAKDIALTGRTFNGIEAFRMGVVNGVAKNREQLDTLVKKYSDELIGSAPLAVGMGKRLIDSIYGQNLEFGLEMEGLANSQLLTSKDFMTGVRARIMRQRPLWEGK
ncbi:MAG: enoyl-CoA hydratase/isomerase family protein [Candidatus Lokiarchaeota archaeon]|nr:enoyl-CoA hydratase/isomerase family protein [Candidatus Lokiarchaeota archaeon]